MEHKAGWKTTEFWRTIAIQLIALGVLFGFITPQSQAGLEGGIKTLVESIGALLTIVLAEWKYVSSRVEVKKMETEAIVAIHNNPNNIGSSLPL